MSTRRSVDLLALCLVGGLLLAGLAFPVVGALGLLAKAGAVSFDKLPEQLVEPPLPQSSRILAADGSTLAVAYFNENRLAVTLDQVAPVMRQAILAIEDARYYEHGGVDVKGLLRAVVRNSQSGSIQQGGSTITQQYVKNVLIERASDRGAKHAVAERSAARKLREARYAIALERRYTKAQILEKYLNIAYFGSGVYGVGTAAQHYFGVPAARLTLPQAALLAGLVKNPRAYDPERQPRAARGRRDVVLDRMAEVGFASAATVSAAKRAPLGLHVSRVRGIEDNPVAPYFLDYLRSYVLDDPDRTMAPVFGLTPEQRAQRLFQGGLTIRTSLDRRLQGIAQSALRAHLGAARDPASAAVVVEPGTGLVRVMAGLNHERGSRKVNLPLGGASGFQAGSTFKVFVLAAAVEQGIPLGLTLHAPQRYRSHVFTDVKDGRVVPYEIGNAGDSEAGVFDLPRATWDSVNTYFLQLEERTGVHDPARIARDLGVTRFPLHEVPSLVLGTNEVSPLDMASAYATLAARGTYCRPLPITVVTDAAGRVVGRPVPSCHQAIPAATADVLTSVLRGVIERGTGRAAAIGRPAAGKTGTTNGPTAAWFDGYTPGHAGVVWVGYPTDPARHPLLGIEGVRVMYGGTIPARIWHDLMVAAEAGQPVRTFALPPAATHPAAPTPTPGAAAPPPPPGPPRRCHGKHCGK